MGGWTGKAFLADRRDMRGFLARRDAPDKADALNAGVVFRQAQGFDVAVEFLTGDGLGSREQAGGAAWNPCLTFETVLDVVGDLIHSRPCFLGSSPAAPVPRPFPLARRVVEPQPRSPPGPDRVPGNTRP